MAETHDTRPWQAGVDPALVTRLQRPLRRSAAIACAWAREALARGRRGRLPLFASWAVRWGMNEAAVAGLRPIVHALPYEHAPGSVVAPAIAAVQARLAPEAPRTAIVAVARAAATGEREVTRGGTAGRSTERSQPAASSELRGPSVATSTGPHEVVRGEPAGSQPAVVDRGPQVAVTPRPDAAATGLDLRVDPALLIAATRPAPAAGPPIMVHAPASESGLPMRPRARPRLVTTMDLARAQQLAAPSQPTVTVAATEAPVTPPREAPASFVVTHELDELGASIVVPPRSAMPLSVDARTTIEAAPAVVHALAAVVHAPPPSSPAAPLPDAARAIAGPDGSVPRDSLATSSAVAPARVRGRVVAAPVSPVLVDSIPNIAATRPRVSLPSPTLPPTPGLTAASSTTPTQPAASRIDVALPAAQPSTTPQPAAPSPPAARPMVARVETSQLDIPAIAQAVHRHLERELRWERERRGGRP